MILAANCPHVINKLVVSTSSVYIIKQEADLYKSIRDVNKWSENMKAPMVEFYGLDVFQNMWNGWCDAYKEYFRRSGDKAKGDLPKIVCPTLLLHGDKDLIVAPEQPLYLLKHIKHSKLHRVPDGKHNLHIKYSKEFNALVTKFLLE